MSQTTARFPLAARLAVLLALLAAGRANADSTPWTYSIAIGPAGGTVFARTGAPLTRSDRPATIPLLTELLLCPASSRFLPRCPSRRFA